MESNVIINISRFRGLEPLFHAALACRDSIGAASGNPVSVFETRTFPSSHIKEKP